ncbi:MAG: helix-turn-helix domain-containing protein [Solobacterium sp.]|nr:helix-turn-helix domain-containing protein [Solobacterium sp.]MBR3347612.1 helix-turn-helix domain-containing protein [Solobacterium sp.]
MKTDPWSVDQCLRSQMTKGEQGVIQPDWQSNRQNGTQLACDDAKEQLINTDRSVSEIAMMTGFSNADYLSSSFHRHEGMTPTVFRKEIRSDDRRTIKNAINR